MEVKSYTIQEGDHYWRIAEQFGISIGDLFKLNPGVHPNRLKAGQTINVPHSSERQDDCISRAEVELMSNMRRLWEEHIAWTRMTIISLTFNLPDIEEVITRLLQNATDMGNAIRPYYGKQHADTFADLIKEHLLFAADLVNAALAGDQQAAQVAEQNWYANADQIAVFLSEINPYLTEEEVREMFYTHLDLTKQEAILMINMDYARDIMIYDEIEDQALAMADAITQAIVQQFPEMFGY